MVGYMSGTRCEWFAYGTGDATATLSSRALLITKMVNLPFWCQLAQVVLENKPLNGCHCCLYIYVQIRAATTLAAYCTCLMIIQYPVVTMVIGHY